MYKWVKATKEVKEKGYEEVHLLLNANTPYSGEILAYIAVSGVEYNLRRLTTPAIYNCDENDIVFCKWLEREVIAGQFKSLPQAKDKVEKALGIICVEGDTPTVEVMKFLAKLKNIEVFGKIELVIRIEGLPNSKEVKQNVVNVLNAVKEKKNNV